MNRLFWKIGVLMLAAGLFCLAVPGRSAQAALPLPEPSDQSKMEMPPEGSVAYHVLQAGDRVKIRIYPEDQYITGVEMAITTEGNVTLPLVGKVSIAGKTILEAERELVRMIDADYLVDPEVVIEVVGQEEGFKLPVSVLGAVKNPGNYELELKGKPATLIQAVLKAGGFSDVANIKKIKIVRKAAGGNKMIRANAEDIVSGKAKDIPLEDGDIIHVSESIF